MLAAVKSVVYDGLSIRKAAVEKGVSKTALGRYVKNYKDNPNTRMAPNYWHSQVFSTEQETSLADYLIMSSRMFHGLTPSSARRLAFEMAERNNMKFPEKWNETKMAGRDWFTGFLKRHPQLSIRTPEATSLARATAFNRHTVGRFFDLLETVITDTNAEGRRIYNLDESGFTTVQKVPKVVAEKGCKQVGQVTSRERGELVTCCAIISATGVGIPPVLIFPRKKFRETMMNGAPEGSLGLVNDTGWMTSILFEKVMVHVVNNTGASKDNPIILTMDNHDSHISVAAVTYAKDHGVHILTLPPHTSNKTQPLDRTVFSPMKTYYNCAADSWMMRNPGKTITIFQVAELVGEAWVKAGTPSNIMAGFKAAGIWPYDRNVFSDEAFLPSSVTDRPQETDATPMTSDDPHTTTSTETVTTPQAKSPPSSSTESSEPHVNTPSTPPRPSTSQSVESNFVSPEVIRGYPKVCKRNQISFFAIGLTFLTNGEIS